MRPEVTQAKNLARGDLTLLPATSRPSGRLPSTHHQQGPWSLAMHRGFHGISTFCFKEKPQVASDTLSRSCIPLRRPPLMGP